MTDGQVDLWHLSLDDDAPGGRDRERRAAALLGPDERARAAQLTDAVIRRRYLFAHALTRLVLARATGVPPHAVTWRTGPHGKPGPVGGGGRPLHWNLSHSGDHALLAVSRRGPLGVDVQEVPDTSVPALDLARRYLPPEACAMVAAADGGEAGRRTALTRALCRTEARVKADGGRLLDALRPTRSSPARSSPAPAVVAAVPPSDAAGERWQVWDLPGPPGCVAALAVPDHHQAPLIRTHSLTADALTPHTLTVQAPAAHSRTPTTGKATRR